MRASVRAGQVVGAALVLAIAVGANGTTVRAQENTPAGASAPRFRDVVDEAGRTVRIPQPVTRIVSLAPSVTETVYALGAQERLVGDTDFCDYPPDAQKKQKVGGALNPSLEEIAALHPDVVLAAKRLNRLETVLALQTLHIPAYATDPETVEQIISSTLRLADILGVPDAGDSVASDLRRRLDELQERLAKVTPSRVLFVVWDEPLISVGKDTFITDALRYAGATSVVESTQSWPQISLEEIVRLQPDFLVFTQNHASGGTVDVEALATRPGWRGLEAVRRHRYAVISEAVNRPAPRIVSAIEDLARQLHPEAFEAGQARPVAGGSAMESTKDCSCAL